MARRNGSGGAIVLVIFLVFFILLSLGLGVAAYLGFAQDDSKDKKIADWENKFKVMEKERDWYHFQADLYRCYMGQADKVELGNLAVARDKFNNGTLGGPAKDKDEVTKFITTVLDKNLAWDAAQKRPKQTYESLLKAEAQKAIAAQQQGAAFAAAADAAKLEGRNLQEQLDIAKKTHNDEYAAFTKNANDRLQNYLVDNQKLTRETEALNDKLAALARANDDDKRRLEKTILEKERTIADIRNVLKDRDDKLREVKRDLGREMPTLLNMEWKVVRIDPRGDTAFINLGSADKVQPQLTFRVHGIGPDGRAVQKDKAAIEVLNVLGEHLSQVKVAYVTTPRDKPRHDPLRNPVLPGDVLINPSWNPNAKRHVAFAGVVDLTGDGRDDTEQFIRALGKQNIIVDAYLDLTNKDFPIRGPGITVQTDFLILGDKPALLLGVQGEERKSIEKNLEIKINEMKKQASTQGVQVRSLRKFMEEIGFRVPGNPAEQQPTLDLRSDPVTPPKKQLLPPPGDKPVMP